MEQFESRKYFIIAGILIILAIYLVRLFYMQIFDVSYKISAENNARFIQVIYPARGLIYDRKGKLMVYNQPVYDLLISPYQLKEFDTNELCSILNIDKEYLKKKIKDSFIKKYRREPLIKQISAESYGVLQEKLYKYQGFYFQPRVLRKYADPIAAHLLGYVREVNEKEISGNDYYMLGDYIGASGLEQSYEKELCGIKGQKIFNVDSRGRIQGSYRDGQYDMNAVVGKNITISIDAEIQKYGELLMAPFIGSVVAIEPSSGEILALISSPTFDPGMLVGRERTKNYTMLYHNTSKPLFNRALMAKYPPGSTFKIINGLIALQEKVISPSTIYGCKQGFFAGPIKVGCHKHTSPLDFKGAVKYSCNAYFCNAFRNIIEDKKFHSATKAFINWRSHVMSFGFGQSLDSDFKNELTGFVPSEKYYNRYYGENRWKALTIISLAIGQGEMLITPIQMANMTATIANGGYYYTPHVIKLIDNNPDINTKYRMRKYTTIDSSYFRLIIEGMHEVVEDGTAAWVKSKDFTMCGKTGTAQNPHGKDHSIFIAFAPKENPQIAIAVYIENRGFGSSYAAPIASLMIEKYLTDTIRRPFIENYIMKFNETAP